MLNPSLDYVGTKVRVKFNGNCLKQEKVAFNLGKIVNIYVAYKIERNVNISSYPTLENCLSVAVKLTKHVDVDLYKYPGYGVGFNRRGFFFQSVIKLEKCNNFWSRYLHSLIITKKFCLSLHYNWGNSYLFVNGMEIIKFKAKDSETAAYLLCLGNISNDCSVHNMNKTELRGYVYDFSVDYNDIAVSDILDTHKHLMKKNEIVFVRRIFVSTMMLFGCVIHWV